MIIKDTKEKYCLKVEGDIVYETLTGLFSDEDALRFHNDYVEKIFPLFKNKERWCKICDARKYELYLVQDYIKWHIDICVKNGMEHGVIIASSKLVEIGIRQAVGGNFLKREGIGTAKDPKIVSSIEEGKEWLKNIGYK